MERDKVSQEKIFERMSYQMDEEEKMKRCDHVIVNDDRKPVLPQVLALHQTFLERAARSV